MCGAAHAYTIIYIFPPVMQQYYLPAVKLLRKDVRGNNRLFLGSDYIIESQEFSLAYCEKSYFLGAKRCWFIS